MVRIVFFIFIMIAFIFLPTAWPAGLILLGAIFFNNYLEGLGLSFILDILIIENHPNFFWPFYFVLSGLTIIFILGRRFFSRYLFVYN